MLFGSLIWCRLSTVRKIASKMTFFRFEMQNLTPPSREYVISSFEKNERTNGSNTSHHTTLRFPIYILSHGRIHYISCFGPSWEKFYFEIFVKRNEKKENGRREKEWFCKTNNNYCFILSITFQTNIIYDLSFSHLLIL